MNRYMYIWTLVFFLFPLSLFSEEAWKESSQGDFSARLEVSSLQVEIPTLLEVRLSLHFPESYDLDHSLLIDQLLSHSGLTAPPFLLQEMHLEEALGQTILKATLEPQLPGRFPVTFYTLDFLGEEALVQLASPLLFVQTSLPEVDPDLSLPLASLLQLRVPRLSEENLNRWVDGKNVLKMEAKRNIRSVRAREIPWEEALLVVFVLSLACLGFFWLTRKRSQKPKSLASAVSVEKRMINMLSLAKEGKEVERCYEGVSDFARLVLEEKWHLAARMKTKEELEREREWQSLPEEESDNWKRLLEEMDVIKFSPRQATVNECEKAYRLATKLFKT